MEEGAREKEALKKTLKEDLKAFNCIGR